MRASFGFLYIHIYSSLDEPMLQKLKTFAVHSACVRPFDYCFDWRIETGERERGGEGGTKTALLTRFQLSIEITFSATFSTNTHRFAKKDRATFKWKPRYDRKNSIPLHGNRWFPRQCAIGIFNKYLDFNIYQRILTSNSRENLIERRHRFFKVFAPRAGRESRIKKVFSVKNVSPSQGWTHSKEVATLLLPELI